ncbi:ABC transporter ATP-binding protein [Enterococcus alcedinis]|uniref:ABC transporter n=1 Tax=Enterococcus alcedinis TaxID=1274384 RepID=A0A917N6U4_9ENTE|nr:ABC transporter ATP-binding protein [Enterococcus alcedinis]MBP2102643.1 iron complex transport system ATP-binding protein [Enterococcus alcedinis]GGI66202.1 ABC transporter [Enterococcus alcedinis]
MLEIQNLSVKLGKKDIIQQLSISMDTHQFVGIIGANGSGKSTLLKTIYKGLIPTTGKIIYNKMDLLNTYAKKVAQKLSVVGQFNELSFDFTVFQMVLLGRTPHKRLLETDSQEDYEIVENALKEMGLTDYRNESFLSLSGGEKQRVILARALAQQPEFLILDEPTNHLDIRYQLELMESVKNLNIGILAALHDLDLAAAYCDYVFAMKNGEIIAAGTPEEIFTEALIEDLYGIRCVVYRNPITKHLAFHYYI